MPVISQVGFHVVGAQSLAEDELQLLGHLQKTALTSPKRAQLLLELTDAPPAGIDLGNAPSALEADVSYNNGALLLRHVDFAMEMETPGDLVRLFRAEKSGFSLYFGIRNAWLCSATALGILPLHSSALAIDGRAVAFFGVSGAGKTTLSSRSPFPVISDELVAIERTEGGWTARSSGFWGRESRLDRFGPIEEMPLAALVSLEQGRQFSMGQVSRMEGVKRLLPSVMLPPVPHLWRRAMESVNALAGDVPIFRMAWSLDEEPWAAIRRTLRL